MKLFRSSTTPRQLWRILTLKDRGLIMAAMAAAGMLWLAGLPPVETLLLVLLAGSVVTIAICDLRHRIIPDLISLPLVAAGIGFTAFQGREVLLAHAATAAVAAALLLALRAGHYRLRQRTGLGLGDIKLVTAAAAWIGPLYLANYILLSALSALGHVVIRRSDRDPRGIPFGVPLALWLWVFAVFMAL
jgi:leader peptidase (prepilin peptidase)/N-methyltransferase